MATFLLEVGSEELPASFVPQALAQWQSRVLADLQDQALTPSALHLYGTPRRLALLLEGLPDRQPNRTEAVKGPPALAAFKDGQPTAAATGFARSRG
jgi:glycyl-tRNA synthetase beta chain